MARGAGRETDPAMEPMSQESDDRKIEPGRRGKIVPSIKGSMTYEGQNAYPKGDEKGTCPASRPAYPTISMKTKGVSEFEGEILGASRKNHLIEMQGVDGFYEEWTNQGEDGNKKNRLNPRC
jgi:hypothetical protein